MNALRAVPDVGTHSSRVAFDHNSYGVSLHGVDCAAAHQHLDAASVAAQIGPLGRGRAATALECGADRLGQRRLGTRDERIKLDRKFRRAR